LLQLSGYEPLQQENEGNEQQICSKNMKKKYDKMSVKEMNYKRKGFAWLRSLKKEKKNDEKKKGTGKKKACLMYPSKAGETKKFYISASSSLV